MKVMAKDLVRTRRYTKKFIMMRAQIQAVSLKITTLKSQNAMAQAMKGVTRAMMNMNQWVLVMVVCVCVHTNVHYLNMVLLHISMSLFLNTVYVIFHTSYDPIYTKHTKYPHFTASFSIDFY